MATHLFNGKVDLGNAAEMFASFAHFGRLSPDLTYDALHGSLHAVLAEDDQVHPDDLARLRKQIAAFRKRFASELTDHDRWLLDQLRSAT